MSFNGDLNSLMRLIFLEKNDVTFGVLIGLTLLVVVLMLIRSVMEEKEGAAAGSGAAIDSKSLGLAVEGALKKALSDKTVGSSAGADATATASGGGEASADLKRILDEREAKIAALMSDLDLMKNQLDAKPADPIAGAGNADSVALHAKLAELQAKLSEYEIIEDDIADLSSFKDENKRLKEELERLRAAALTAQTQVQAAQVAPVAPPAVDPVQAVQTAVAQAAQTLSPVDEFAETIANEKPETTPAAPAPSEPFKLDPADDVMGEFAQAISVAEPAATETSAAPSPPVAATPVADAIESLVVSGSSGAVVDPQAAIDALMAGMTPKTDGAAPTETAEPAGEEADAFGPLDTEKMLAEVASMKEETGDAASVLDEPLDTERLMAEMGMTDAAPTVETPLAAEAVQVTEDDPAAEFAAAVAGVSSGVANAKPAPVTTMTPPTPAAPVVPPPAEMPVDDLLAEFKDTDFQSKGTKGS